MRKYTKPVVSVDNGMAEGVYTASGSSKGSLTVTYYGVWDRWGTNGGKGLAIANWSDIDGTITLTLNFNEPVDQIDTAGASANVSISGNVVTLTFASTATNPMNVGIHLDHGTSIDDLKMTGYSYSVS